MNLADHVMNLADHVINLADHMMNLADHVMNLADHVMNLADHVINYHISIMKHLRFLKLLNYISFKLILWPIFILHSSNP
jgi:hypothetical protein